ncbi:MAG: CRISPR-associated endoribonuclease Cas6 [Bacteroidota bacterium]
MRFKLTLRISKEGQRAILPINYQYPVSSWIYKVLNSGNSEFTQWLHTNGYKDGNKQFRLFNFSRILVKYFNIKEDRMIIKQPEISLYISFYPIETLGHFITGLFKNQECTIGDNKSQASFTVQAVEKLPEPYFHPNVTFKTLSPLLISHKETPAQKYATYKHLEEEDYGQLFINNLITKYNAFYTLQDIDKCIDKRTVHAGFKLLNTPKSNLISIKSGTQNESKLKAYSFQFQLIASEPFIRFGYYAGFGEKNSLGFGCVKYEV